MARLRAKGFVKENWDFAKVDNHYTTYIYVFEYALKITERLHGCFSGTPRSQLQDTISEFNSWNRNPDIEGRTLLHAAAVKGNLELVKQLVQHSEDLLRLQNEGKYCLTHKSVDYCIIDRKDKVTKNPLDVNGVTPLHLASSHGHLAIVKFLLLFLSDKNPKSGRHWNERTPLHAAAIEGHLHIIKCLLENINGDINPSLSDGWTVLHCAAEPGHLNVVSFYTRRLPNPNPGLHKNDQLDGRTPLHIAAENGQLAVVQHICSLLDDKNPMDANGYTPLHIAASFGRIDVVKFLLPLLLDKNPKSGSLWYGRTPLHNAAINGHLHVIKLMLEHLEGDINPSNKSGETVLHYAAMYGRLDVVKFYTEQLANPNPSQISTDPLFSGRTPLHYAAENGHFVTVQHICSLLADKNPKDSSGNSVLHLAVAFGHVEVVKYLVIVVDDVHSKNNLGRKTPLDLALLKGHSEIVYILRKHIREDVLYEFDLYTHHPYYEQLGKGRSILHAAAAKGHLQLVKQLVQNLEDKNPPDDHGLTPLHLAAEAGQFEVVKFLIPFHRETNLTNPEIDSIYKKRSPLHDAGMGGHLNIIEYLLENIDGIDGDINPSCGNGDTVLHIAAERGHLNVVEFYTEKLPNPNPGKDTSDEFRGRTPLHIAAQCGHLPVVQHICSILSNKNPKDSEGSTPLHLAAQEGHTKVVKYLVQHVGDIHPRRNTLFGLATPFDLANEAGHTAIVNILRPCQTAQKSVKKARRREEETEIENILQHLGIDDEKEKAKKKVKKKAKKTKRPQVSQAPKDEEASPAGAVALIDPVPPIPPVQENVEEEGGDECTICFGLLIHTYMFYPCGHATFCKDCASRLFKSADNRCPDCRTLIKDTVRVFGTTRRP